MTRNARVSLTAKLLALVTALFAMIAMAVPASTAMAVDSSDGNAYFNKYLLVEKGAKAPNLTFGFTIGAGAAVSAGAGNPAIYAGVSTKNIIIGNSGSVTFSPNDQVYSEAQPDDAVDLKGKSYAKQQVTVDLSGVTFPAPGIYRYIITEIDSSAKSVTNDATTTRTLDVYVENDTDGVKVAGYAMYSGTVDNTNLSSGKSDGFTNEYATNALTLKKNVTGNQGDLDKYFAFTVTLTGNDGDVYSVDLTNAESSLTVDGSGMTNAAALSVSNGSVASTYYLKNGQSIVIHGLNSDARYDIDEADYSNDGYATSYQIDSEASVNGHEMGVAKTMNDTGHTVTFTNNKEGSIPATGLLLEVAPYALLVVVIAGGLVALTLTSRKQRNR